jgi:hypothetical protein
VPWFPSHTIPSIVVNVRFAAKRKRGQKAAPFASDCAARTFLTAAVDLNPKERRHPEPGALRRNVVILSRRLLPSEGSERAARRAAEAQKRAFSTLPPKKKCCHPEPAFFAERRI